MLYVIVRNRGTDDADVCVCKANSNEQAKKMVGVEESHTDWCSLTDEQAQTIVSAKEGYLARSL